MRTVSDPHTRYDPDVHADATGDLVSRLATAARVTILTGAGVSAPSGVPTFRGADGFWRSRRAEELATPEAFARDPEGVWAWYAWRRVQVAACVPNEAHRVLAAWATSHSGWRVITQNVDDLHLRAGTPGLIRLHGSLWNLRCSRACTPAVWRDEDLSEDIRRCPACGAYARPGVVWFGEALDDEVVREALRATACEVFLTVGTSSVVYPAAGLVHEASRRGAFTAELNLEPTPASAAVDLSITGACEQILPALAARLAALRA